MVNLSTEANATIVLRTSSSLQFQCKIAPSGRKMNGVTCENNYLSMEEGHADLLASYCGTLKDSCCSCEKDNAVAVVPCEKQDIDDFSDHHPAVLPARSIKTVKIHRTKSVERHLNEAAQFCEAIGENPPTDHTDLQEIIEVGSYYSLDDEHDDEHDETTHSFVEGDHDTGAMQQETSFYLGSQVIVQGLEQDTVRKQEHQQLNLPLYVPDSDLGGENQLQQRIPQYDDSDQCNSHLRNSSLPSCHRNDLFTHTLPAQALMLQGGGGFEYRGICANPPEITKRGISRGNYSQLHRKAWLEVSDKKHRYGKNLRLYYRHWESLGYPTNNFFDWLDSKGDAAGAPLPNLDECPRQELDSDTVLYISDIEITRRYALNLNVKEHRGGRCQLLTADNEPIRTSSEGWIFVLRDNELFGAPKITCISQTCTQRFHHSSFFGGKAVAAAGILVTDEDGFLMHFYPHSGHYRPGEAEIQRMLFFLHSHGVSLRSFLVDTQQLFRIDRKVPTKKDKKSMMTSGANPPLPNSNLNKNNTDLGTVTVTFKKKKIDNLNLMSAAYVANYLSHKARFIGYGIFSQISKIRKTKIVNVSATAIVKRKQ